ncbi:MAG: CHC2 zinc finger domain-containing protein [Anaerolineae bacterium]
MSLERLPNAELNRRELSPYAQTFLSRIDRFARQNRDGSYSAIPEAVNMDILQQHIAGTVTLGAYALNTTSEAKWVCLDADTDTEWHRLRNMAQELKDEHVPNYLEPSLRGGHLWLFLPEPLAGQEARRFARQLLYEQDLPTVEIYPKQDRLRTGPGSLVRLPLGVHRKANHRYHFVDLSGEPIAPTIREQIRILARPERVPRSFVELVLSLSPEPQPIPYPPPFEGKTLTISGGEVSEQIKSRISVYDFVSQFMEINRDGRGLCPFHDDHHMSFSVHRERNFWRCFATHCNKGYTVIDFWMYWRNISFRQAVKELAASLL